MDGTPSVSLRILSEPLTMKQSNGKYDALMWRHLHSQQSILPSYPKSCKTCFNNKRTKTLRLYDFNIPIALICREQKSRIMWCYDYKKHLQHPQDTAPLYPSICFSISQQEIFLLLIQSIQQNV